MLWHKAWLETRWRFITALLILTVLAGGNVYNFVTIRGLLSSGQVPSLSPAVSATAVGAAIRDAIEMQKTFRGFIWSQVFRQNLTQMGVFFAILLGCGGLLSETSKGSSLFTLSLPVTRRQLLGARAGTGLAQWFAIAMVAPLSITVLAPTVGEQFSVADALAHGLCLFLAGAVFFSLSSFLSTLFGDTWRPLLIGIAVACAMALVAFVAPQLSIFRVMGGESYFRTGTLPWAGLLTSAVVAMALLYSAAETLERRDF